MNIDWTDWTPTVRATLLFVLRDGQALLIRKKTGLGAGKINAPGGKLEPGESPLAAAERELLEEVGVRALGTERRGELSFEFLDGLRMHVVVFAAPDCEGEPIETREAIPLWVPVDALPFEEMWPDDRVWVPLLLAARPFVFRAVYDGEVMLAHEVEGGGMEGASR